MLFKMMAIAMVLGIVAGCATTNTRDRPFTGDWADHVRGTSGRGRRTPESGEKRQLGPATITHDESGRPQVHVGGQTGIGADLDYRRGPAGSLRYRHQWDFARPERRR